jgi:hypothetical protein
MSRTVAALAPLLAVLVAGCGSAELSDVQLRKRATELCSTANRQTNRIANPPAPAAASGFLDQGITVFRAELARLRKLRPPSDLASTYNTSVDALTGELSDLQFTARKLRAGQDPVVAIRQLERGLEPLEATENRAWSTLDVPACVDR